LFPLIIFAVSITLQLRGAYDTLNEWILDYRMNNTPITASGDIGILAIDPQSLQDIGIWPWSRAIHGEILDQLALLASFSQFGLDGTIVYSKPYAPFAERSWPALVTVTPDNSGQIRHYPTGADIDGLFVPSAGVQLAGSYANNNQGFIINYGVAPGTIPVFSVSDLLNGQLTNEDIAGRSILIGAAAADLGDHFAVPLHQVLPGVFIHAIAAETLLQNATISSVHPGWLSPLLFFMLCALHFAGRRTAWRIVSVAFLFAVGTETAALMAYQSKFSYLPTAMVHPALIAIALGRLAKHVDLSRLLIKQQKVQMNNSDRLQRHIFENSSDGFLAINETGDIVFQSDVAQAILDRSEIPDRVQEKIRIMLERPDSGPVLDHLELDLSQETKQIELYASVSQLESLDSDNRRKQEPLALLTLRDVTDLRHKQQQIEFLSRHDNRTATLRRHSFCEVVENQIAGGETIAVAALALRRLTAINTTLGRHVGDEIIVSAAKRLMDPALGLGAVGRLDGTVFCAVIPTEKNGQSIDAVCRDIQDVLTQPYKVGGSNIQIGVNVGYAAAEPDETWVSEDYVSRAQDALANAHASSAYIPSAYNSAEGEKRDRSRRLEHALSQALARGEFHLLYQPQYHLSDRSLIGAEALIRWQSNEFGFVSPEEFIPIAESSGFIAELGQFVLENAIEAALSLPNHVTMSPNVSVFQLLSADFPTRVKDLLAKHGLAPERICLELTESEFLSPDSEAVQRMRDLQSYGVTWALDDFGTGYSSLSYLKELPFDKIKLDRAFLKDIFDDISAQSTLRSVVQLVHGYGKSLLCEGAETEREIELLAAFGCDSVQGYYFGRPESFEDLVQRATAEQSPPTFKLKSLG